MQNYHRLAVWRKAHELAISIYRLTDKVPRGSNSGLVGQLRRASLSVPSNIVEGSSRATDRDFAKFLQVALASASEVEYQLEFAASSQIIAPAEFERYQKDLAEVRMMLTGLIKKVRERIGKRGAS